MDLTLVALEEVAFEGLEGTTISGLWKLLQKRRPPVKCAIDKWTKPFIWNRLAASPFIDFYHVDFDSPKTAAIPKDPSDRSSKLPEFWINDHANKILGYCKSYHYQKKVSDQIKGEEKAKMTLEETEEKWGEFLHIVASQEIRQRFLYGTNNPPVIDEVIPVRYIILEIIGKRRWEGFMQADFLKFYGMDSRTSFHHLKVLIRLRLITKQSILLKGPVNNPEVGTQPVPPKSTKMLHLSQFSNVYTNNLQKAAAKICSVLENSPDGIMERNELKQACTDIPMFKKIRQWLFQTGHIQYIVNGEVWNSTNANPIQLSHFRAGRPCFVNLLKKFDVTDVEEENDEFIDYIENCDDIEPQLVYEETLHHQAYQVVVACREKGITMKKLAEVMCVPFTMARSFIRYFDTNKIGRIINVDHLKLKLQKIVAIQYLHQSETVQKIKSNKLKIAQNKALTEDEKPVITTADPTSSSTLSLSLLKERNLELADEVDLTRVSTKSKVSVRHLSRKSYVIDAMKERPVFEGSVDLYKSLVLSEENLKSTQGQCCRKTFRKILNTLIEEKQIRKIMSIIDDSCIPPMMATFFCATHVTEESREYLDAVDSAKKRYENLEKKKELKKAVLEPNQGKCETPKEAKEANEDNPTKIILDFQQPDEVVTDTDDEDFQRSIPISSARDVLKNRKFVTYARFQKLHVLHIYLWHLVYGVDADIEELLIGSHSLRNDMFIDLVQSRHIWLQHVNGLPEYKEGRGWFNVGDILALMPLEVTCRVLGIKCWSDTAIKFLQDPKKRLLKMCELPPRLKYKLLVSQANRLHIDNCVDLLVLMAQMGLIAVAPNYYPKIRTEIMLFLRKEAKITDTRYSQKTYCHVVLPPSIDKFPETVYRFQSLADVEKYWTDLQFVCLNTPLGLNRAQRTLKTELKEELTEEEMALGKQGLNQSSRGIGLGRNFRSFTILKDFTQYYQDKDFTNLEPVVFGNGLGAGGLDAVFFAHLAKNWRYGKQRSKKVQNVKTEEESKNGSQATSSDKNKANKNKVSLADKETNRMIVTSLMVKQRKGGKGLKRKLASSTNVLTKKMKIERKKYFDRMIARRLENVREKIRQQVHKKKAMRKGKKAISALNHDDVDREALCRMKGMRVSFSEREDAYVLLAEIVRSMMKLFDKGQPLEREHKKVLWQAIRDLIHKEVPESCDKTWEAIDRRARNIKKHSHFLIIYNTCVAELEQDKEFMESLKCTRENWKEKMDAAFVAARESYSRHFNYPMHIEKFPIHIKELHEQYEIEFAHKESEENTGFQHIDLQSERDLRTSVLEDLIHCCLTAQKLTTYIPAVAFKVFDAYPPDELNEAFEYYKENRLISRYRVDLPRRRSLPISTMTYNLSTTYYRMFEPVIPLRIYQMARSMYLHAREGKEHSLSWKESDIMKLPNYYEKGSCLIDCENIQGGHIAYLLSVMANKKIFMDCSLPDEMTISDEMHLKKLKEGKLNYQRVAFEQRIRRGESLVEKKLKISVRQELSERKQAETTSFMRKLSETRMFEENTSEVNTPELLSQNTVTKVPTKKNVRFNISDNSNQVSPQLTCHASNMRQHGGIRGFLQSSLFSCSFNSFKTSDSIGNYKGKFVGKQQRCFMYTNEAPKTKRRLLAEKINMFKETKLHASRTSLSMQRSLTGEKFVPTNAMNTHDALVTNPMEIIIHSKSTPFRNLFPRLKINNTQKGVWKRFCENINDDDDDSPDQLSIHEYCDILRENMNFVEFEVQDHITIINKIQSFGVVGMKIKTFKENFPMLSRDTLDNWEYHVQVLLNFKMLHAVGHYDDLLISPVHFPTWCFRCPQVTSQFEHESTKKEDGSEITVPSLESCEASTSRADDDHTKSSSAAELVSHVEQEVGDNIFNSDGTDEEHHGSIPSAATTTSITYKNVKVLPWLKLNGELNNVILKRFHETILVYIIANPGVLETNVMNHFALLLKPASARKILNFLEINGAITKHYMWKKKPTLFGSSDDQDHCQREAYLLPTMQSLLNMTDTNR